VGGGLYQKYAAEGWECRALGPPVKPYQWLSEFQAFGQWFIGGAIYYKFGAWQVAYVDWGQTAGRLTAEPEPVVPDDAEAPTDPPVEPADSPPVPEA
jgi:hypothetical protein